MMRIGYISRIVILVLLSYSYIQLTAGSNDTSKKQLEELKIAAFAAQKTMNRSALDSIADHILDLAKGNHEAYEYLGYYFKADGQSRTNPPLAIEIGQKALNYFEEKRDLFFISRVSNVLANSMSNTGRHRSAVELYTKALGASKAFEAAGNSGERRFQAGITYNAGFAMVRQGDLEAAANFLYEALDIGMAIKDTLVICSVINQIGNLNTLRKNYPKALEHYKEGYQLAKSGSPSSVPYLIAGIAGAHQEMGALDSALYYNTQLVAFFRQQNNNSSLCNSLYNLAEIYYHLKDYDASITTGKELKVLATEMGIDQFVLNAAIILSKAYQAKNEIKTARNYMDEALVKLKPDTEFDVVSNVYKISSELYEQSGELQLALSHNKLFKQYSDSLLNREAFANIDALQIQHETKQKEQRIAQLETQQALDALSFKQKILQGGALILVILLGSIIVFLIINRQRLLAEKQRDSVEQRLLRTQMNPHFIFNAISSIQNYLFDKNDLKVALHYLSKFAELMRQILENSREEYVTLSSEMQSLRNYLELQQLRYSNSFGYELYIDPAIEPEQLLVPPLIAQPFVENAIEHGMIYRIENGKVKISVLIKEEDVIVTIEDNGVGAREMKVFSEAAAGKKKSLSTVMTKERLAHISKMSKRKFDLVISALQTGGTLVTIQLPKVSAA